MKHNLLIDTLPPDNVLTFIIGPPRTLSTFLTRLLCKHHLNHTSTLFFNSAFDMFCEYKSFNNWCNTITANSNGIPAPSLIRWYLGNQPLKLYQLDYLNKDVDNSVKDGVITLQSFGGQAVLKSPCALQCWNFWLRCAELMAPRPVQFVLPIRNPVDYLQSLLRFNKYAHAHRTSQIYDVLEQMYTQQLDLANTIIDRQKEHPNVIVSPFRVDSRTMPKDLHRVCQRARIEFDQNEYTLMLNQDVTLNSGLFANHPVDEAYSKIWSCIDKS